MKQDIHIYTVQRTSLLNTSKKTTYNLHPLYIASKRLCNKIYSTRRSMPSKTYTCLQKANLRLPVSLKQY